MCRFRRKLSSRTMCPSADRCVSRMYSNNAPAAVTAGESSSTSKPSSVFVPKCSWSRRRDSSFEKHHAGRPVNTGPPRSARATGRSSLLAFCSGTIHSAGRIRANSSCNRPGSISETRNRPVDSSSHASPSVSFAGATHAMKLLSRGSSNWSSVSVPGVITRVTSRRTSPLAFFGSST